MTVPPIRKVLFIRHKPKQRSADFLNVIEDGWAGTLRMHCDLHVIDEDFDYGEVCDRLNPDYVVLEDPGGYRPMPVKISNPHARPDIPKIGLQIQDPHDTARPQFLRLLEHMRIDRFFILGTASFRQSPEWDGHCYTLSQYIDEEIYHDYGLEKLIPISVFGGMMGSGFYNWRAQITPRLYDYIPTLIYTHPGYEKEIPRYRFPVMGKDYAMMLNRSHFSLADPTRESYVVRKHLEIPACGTVLVSEKVPEVEAYGFTDLQNCILGTGNELIEKIAYVANTPELYEKIRKNGHDLVHARYTRKHWRWIPDWYECQRSCGPGETVQQQDILGPFTVVPADGNPPALRYMPMRDSDYSIIMKRSMDRILRRVELDNAQHELHLYMQCLGHSNEPLLPLALIALLKGNAAQGMDYLLRCSHIRSQREGIACLDPEEVTWIALSSHFIGHLDDIIRQEMNRIPYLGLRRYAAFADALSSDGQINNTAELQNSLPGDRLSIHWTGQLTLPDWVNLVKDILKANGKPELAAKIRLGN